MRIYGIIVLISSKSEMMQNYKEKIKIGNILKSPSLKNTPSSWAWRKTRHALSEANVIPAPALQPPSTPFWLQSREPRSCQMMFYLLSWHWIPPLLHVSQTTDTVLQGPVSWSGAPLSYPVYNQHQKAGVVPGPLTITLLVWGPGQNKVVVLLVEKTLWVLRQRQTSIKSSTKTRDHNPVQKRDSINVFCVTE